MTRQVITIDSHARNGGQTDGRQTKEAHSWSVMPLSKEGHTCFSTRHKTVDDPMYDISEMDCKLRLYRA